MSDPSVCQASTPVPTQLPQYSYAEKAMKGATPAMVMLEKSGVEFAVHTFDHDLVDAEELGYGRAAAHALGVQDSRVFKTLLAQSEKSAVVAIVPVSSQLSLKSLAQVLGVKRCEMVPANDAQRITGYVVGGISPFGQKKKLLTVVDESANDYSTIFVSGGRRGLDLEVSPVDLIRVLDAKSGAIATTDV